MPVTETPGLKSVTQAEKTTRGDLRPGLYSRLFRPQAPGADPAPATVPQLPQRAAYLNKGVQREISSSGVWGQSASMLLTFVKCMSTFRKTVLVWVLQRKQNP